MKLRRFLPLALLFSFLACDRDDLRGDSASSSTVSLAPRIVSITGAALPKVDSVRIKVVNSTTNVGYYEKSVDWNKHADTIAGIPKSTPVKVDISGVKTQADGSRVVWWSGSSNATFGGAQTIGVESFPVPVAIGDTLAPVLVSRSKDTIQTADSTLRLVWKLGKDTGIVVIVNGETLRPNGDSLVWTHPWNTSGKNTVVADFKDAAGNVTRDSFVAVRTAIPSTLRVAIPTFSVASGTYNDSIHVTLADSTAGAKIEFRLEGDSTWTTYTTPLPLGSNTSLQARATRSGWHDSPIAKATYRFSVANPAFSVPSGSNSNDILSVKLSSATSSAKIEYSLDSTNWQAYTDSLRLGASTTVWARALKAGWAASQIVRASYDVRAAAPKFVPSAGSYDSVLSVVLSTTTPGATIRYTIDSTVPTDSSPIYTAPFLLRSTKTVMAIAAKQGLATSLVASARYAIDTLKAPVFTPPGGTFKTAQTVALSSIYDGAGIHYTLDGTTPTPSSLKYETPINVSGNVTIKAIAVTKTKEVTAVATASYQIGTVGTPTFTPGAGAYLSEQSVALSTLTAEANIRYTLDGSKPSETSPVYTSPIPIKSNTTIRAIAYADGWNASPEASASFLIGAASAPTFSPAAGSYALEQSVSLASSTANAVIYFTTDGSAPNKGSARYTGSISVTSGKTIKAIAVANDSLTSEIASATYLIGTAATPVMSLDSGTYLTARKVALSTTTPGASIRYTTDGSNPTASSTLYVDSIDIASGFTLKAIALATGMANSPIASARYLIGTTGTPTFAPSAGTYLAAQSVALSSSLAGSTIYFTTDGSTPTMNSTPYTTPISVAVGQTIKAFAIAPGAAASTIASATYLIGSTAAPTFTPPAGAYPATQNVTLASTTPGASIHYTLDGTVPTTTSSKYTTSIEVSSGKTIQAIAVADGMAPSPVSSATYLIGSTAAPTFTPPGGSYASTQLVSMASTTKGATIFYTIDGTPPTTKSTVYTEPVSVSKGTVLQAIATAPGLANSSISTSSYLIGSANPPTFLPLGGNYLTPQWVKIASTTPGTSVYYTTDGTDPTTGSTLFKDSLHVTSGMTIKAIATGGGVSGSPVASATYVIGTAGTPTFTPAAGTYATAQLVTLSSSLEGATIYYTTNGAVPTSSSTRYTAPIQVAAGQTLSAIAMAPGKANSSVAVATYVIGVAATPTFTPKEGSYPTGQSVAIASATPGATIYYTLDGTTPTDKSSVFSAALSVNKGQTLKAIAVVDGMANSPLGSATYLIGTVSAPAFNPISGSYTGTQWVTLSSSTKDAKIFYTTDGSDPGPGSINYSGTIAVHTSDTLKAYATVEGMAPSTVSFGRYIITAAAPVFSVKSGTFPTTQSLTLSSSTPGAEIYFTTNGSTPTTASTKYVGAISISHGQTIRAIAVAPGTLNSLVSSETYVIGSVSAPVFTPGTTDIIGTQNVTIASSTPGASIHYTTDGTTPTESSPKYSTPITVGSNLTIKAFATAAGMTSSGITSATYTVTAAPPAFTPTGGVYATAQNVVLSSATPNAKFYYTTDGKTPTPTTGTLYNGPISVPAGLTLKAIATATGAATSQVSLATYVVGTAGLPSFSPGSGPYTGTQTVSITSSTTGAAIHFTTNNSTPTTNSPKYSGPIAVTVNQTVKAIAVAAGMSNSEVASATYAITASAPTFSPAGGSYGTAQQVTLSSSTPGATIHYTINGSNPTTSSTPYNGAITVSSGTTIRAIAVANGTTTSLVSSAAYVIGAVSAPTFNPIAGPYTGTVNVTLSSGTSGASIYYTKDGSTPSESKTRYTGSIPVTESDTILAVAVANGMASSSVSSAAYIITAVAPTFSVTSGSYPNAISLVLSTPTPGAKIHYTTNGSNPTTASTEYIGAIPVSTGMIVRAVAKAPGTNVSLVSSETYVIGSTSAPTFSPAPGTFANAQVVSITSSIAGAKIYYTTDGNPPSAASALYEAPLAVGANTTLKAIAIATGMSNSDVTTGLYSIRAGAPTFTPVAGQYSSARSVTLASSTPNATIYYTTNGSTPSINSLQFTTPIDVDTNQTIRAFATAAGMTNSLESSSVYTIQAATPVFSVAAGTYIGSKVVLVTSGSPNATIRYTTNGSDPTGTSAVYSTSFTVDSSMTLKAIASAPNLAPSAIASVNYRIQAVAPSFSVAPGPTSATKILTLASPSPGATFRYTTDGTDPTRSSTPYAASITIDRNMTVKAITVAAGMDSSAVTSAAYTIQAQAPTFTPAGGTYSGSQSVTLSSSTPGAQFRYTTDGSTPTTASAPTSGLISVGANMTIKAITVAADFDSSAVTTATYTIQAGAPVFSLPGGTYTGTQSLSLTGPGTIRYTTDNTDPALPAAETYSGPISIARGMIVRAISTVAGQANSVESSESYLVKAVAPTFDVPAGAHVGAQTLHLTSTTAGAPIYYTTDGSDPTIASNLYPGPAGITVDSSMTITAMVIPDPSSGISTSAPSNRAFTIQTPTPTFTDTSLTYDSVLVTLTAPAGASIRYTIDGLTDPTTPAGTAYTAPFWLFTNTTVKAVAVAPGQMASAGVTLAYKITAAGP